MPVEKVRAVRKVVVNDQIDVPITIEICARDGIGVPSPFSWHYLARYIARVRESAWHRRLAMEERNRSSSPVVDENIYQAVLIEISR
jgi:hypothetical protein